MNLQSAMNLHQLRTTAAAQLPPPRMKVDAGNLAVAVFRTMQGTAEANAGSWRNRWLSSEKFYLLDIPISRAVVPHGVRVDSDQVGLLMASTQKDETYPVLDLNKRRLGEVAGGYVPPVVVVAGMEKVEAMRRKGVGRIRVWVGNLAAEKLNLIQADHQFGAEELRNKLYNELREMYPPKKDGESGLAQSSGAWIREVYPFEKYVIYEHDGKIFKHAFKINNGKRTVVLTGSPTEVTQKYVPLSSGVMNQEAAARLFGGHSVIGRPLSEEAIAKTRGASNSELAQNESFKGRTKSKPQSHLPEKKAKKLKAKKLTSSGKKRKGDKVPNLRTTKKHRGVLTMKLRDAITLHAYGTSEGACKAVKTKGHQSKKGCGTYSRRKAKRISEDAKYKLYYKLSRKAELMQHRAQLAEDAGRDASQLYKKADKLWKEAMKYDVG